jgi:ABC-type sugar transport system substrate-binding protein
VDWVKTNWTGDVADVWVVNPENPEVGEEPAKRISCMEEAVKAGLPEIPASQYARIPGGSFTDEAYEAMTTWLTANPDAGLVLATTINDQGAVGASTACDAASRACAVVGKGAEPQAWAELDKPAEESTFVATISYMFTEYGRYLVPIVLDQIEGKTVPDPVNNYIFTLDRANMSQFTGLRPPK